MNISFIGAGKVGTSLGIYLKNNHFNILGYYSRSFLSAKKASGLTTSIAFEHIWEALEADLVFITVNDDAITTVTNNIAHFGNHYDHKIFVHTSGALTSTPLEILKNKTSHVVSIHPIQAFTDINSSVAQLKNTVFSIEGDPECIPTLKTLLDECGNKYLMLDKTQKPLYHAGACVLSNYLVALLSYGFSMLTHIGLPEDLAIESFFPLIASTLDNVKHFGPADALTGPIARGDLETIQKHLEAFDLNNFNNTELYKVMGLSTLELANTSTLKNKDISLKISSLLEDNNEN